MDLSQQHTQMDTAQWYANRVLDGGLAMCKQIAALPDSLEFLKAADIIQRLHIPNGDRDLFYDPLETADLIFKMAVEYMSLTAWTDQVHAQTMPFTLAIGLHNDLALAELGLYGCARDWKAILEVESAVFNASHPDVDPVLGNSNYNHDLHGDSHADLVNRQLGPGHSTLAGRFPFLKQVLEDLDFHKHQVVREACFLFDQGDKTSGICPWDPLLPDGEQLLWQMFATPANTKFWCEDMFRDITGILGNRAFNCSRFSRMEAVVKASEMRCSDPMPHVSLSFQDVGGHALPKNQRRVTNGCFAVQTDSQKTLLAGYASMTFDLGQPFQGNAPLIDVTPLMDVPPKKKQKVENAHGPDSTPGPASKTTPSKKTWKPAGQESNHKSVAAMALIAEMLQQGWQDKEQMAADSWWAVLLRKGLVFKYFDQELNTHRIFMPLGYHGHATLRWELELIEGSYLQLSKTVCRENRCGTPSPFFWMFGHRVKHVEQLQGLMVEVVIPALMPHVPGLVPGLMLRILKEQDLIAFCFQSKVPLNSGHMTMLARFLGVRLQRVVSKTASQEANMLAGLAIAGKVLPDMSRQDREELVKAMVSPGVQDLPLGYDLLLLPVIEEVQARHNLNLPKSLEKAIDSIHAAAKGMHVLQQGEKPKIDRRTLKAMAKAQQFTPLGYRSKLPGDGLIPGCRLVVLDETCCLQGYYPKGDDNVRGSRWQWWGEGHQTKDEALKVVLDWMWSRHRWAAGQSGLDLALRPEDADMAKDVARHATGHGKGRGKGRGRGRGRGRARGSRHDHDGHVRSVANILSKVMVKAHGKGRARGRGRGAHGHEQPVHVEPKRRRGAQEAASTSVPYQQLTQAAVAKAENAQA